jgi:cellobiose phosphorylase
VMIAGLFLYAARELAALYAHLGRIADEARIFQAYDELLAAVEAEAWDGEWYLRAFDAAGEPVGTHVADEGRIFVESQSWCALGGAGDGNGRARQALESVQKHLATVDGVALHRPPFTRYRPELGEITSYPPGYKENGSIFCHTNPWVTLSWCLLGEGDRALESYLAICPATKDDRIDTYRNEPYVYAQTIAGPDAATPGEAKNSWLTGTAAWALVALTQGILGVKPDYRGLRIDPCIPPAWDSFHVTRRFRGVVYEITVRNPHHVSCGVRSLTVDGSKLTGDLVPDVPGKTTVQVEVVLGGNRPARRRGRRAQPARAR